jgi:hypothetical protein
MVNVEVLDITPVPSIVFDEPVKAWFELPANVPLTVRFPVMVIVPLPLSESMPPALIVKEFIVVFPCMVMFAPLTIMTSSVFEGTTFPTQLPLVLQLPVTAFDVIVAALTEFA